VTTLDEETRSLLEKHNDATFSTVLQHPSRMPVVLHGVLVDDRLAAHSARTLAGREMP
jgi:hypothetical protein